MTSPPVIVPRTNINVSARNDPAGQLTVVDTGDLAIDPTNAPYYNHLLGVSNAGGHIGVYETNNGATTWRTHPLGAPPAPYTGFAWYPSVGYDTLGNGFVSFQVYNNQGSNNRIALARRLAGASSFSAPTLATNTPMDRQRMVIDRSNASPRRDTIYLAWTDLDHVMVASSHDHGVSFSAPVRVDDGISTGHFTVRGPYPIVAADGTLYVGWLDVPRAQLRIDRSTDGGVTWGTDHVIHQLAPLDPTRSGATPIPAAENGAANTPFCDVSRANGAQRGTIYCVFHDLAANESLDVFITHSSDGGASWTTPERLGDDPASVVADQFLPRIQIDDGSGKINVVWYDTRNDPARLKTDVYFTRSNDGSTFATPVKVTTRSSDVSGSIEYYGESIGIAAFLGRVRVMWMDTRTGGENVFSAIIDFGHFNFRYDTSGTLAPPHGGSAQLSVSLLPVNGFTSPVTLSILGLPVGASGSFSVNPVPINGSTVMTVQAGSASPGTYTPRLKGVGGGESDSRPFTLVIK